MSSAVGNVPAQFSPTTSQLDMAYSVCRSIARAAAKNFYYGFMVLPLRKRNALSAVYAFMRRCDDIADDHTLSPYDRRNKLADWLDRVHRALAAFPTDDPVLLALADAQRTYQIPIGLLDQLAYGTAADLDRKDERSEDRNGGRGNDRSEPSPSGESALVARYQTFEELRQYCYGVASVVGLVCIKIFGYRDPAAEPLAERCGLAFQLTNIIRDVKEDAAMGRVYFPREDLEQFGLSAADLAAPQIDVARIRPLLAMEADRARECYLAGEELVPLVNEDSQPGLWVLITIYHRLLEKIALKQYDVFSERVRLTVPEKLSVLGKGILKRLL
jgi:15-cis-phytoene synthase